MFHAGPMTHFLFFVWIAPGSRISDLFFCRFTSRMPANLVSPRCFKKRCATFILEGALAVVQVVVGVRSFGMILFFGTASSIASVL